MGTFVLDGRNLFISVPGLKRYTVNRVSPTYLRDLPEAKDDDSLREAGLATGIGAGLVLQHLLTPGAMARSLGELPDGIRFEDRGLVEMHGVRCHRVALVSESGGIQPTWWVTERRPRRLAAFQHNPQGAGDVLITFHKWRIDEPLPCGTFDFVAPKGSKKAASLLDE